MWVEGRAEPRAGHTVLDDPRQKWFKKTCRERSVVGANAVSEEVKAQEKLT